ncbi:MAG: DNA methyltransferase [Candidatus Aminicenantales bacterium]
MDPNSYENTLYYGDNLDILKRYIHDESVDLVYLDPPFKSSQNYNILFKEKNGSQAASQIRAFEDTWTWSQDDEEVFADLVTKGGKLADCLQAFRTFMGPCDMLAYLVMMAPRLSELRRVMKPTASIYLHCDPTASHYLKMLMDSVFGFGNFRNEIVWQRTGAHNDPKQWGRVADTLLFYSKSENWLWNPQFEPYTDEYLKERYKYVDEKTGRLHWRNTMTASGGGPAKKFRGVMMNPPPGTHWRYSQEVIDQMEKEGRIYYSPSGKPYVKSYLDEQKGRQIQSIWTDIVMSKSGKERLGYPTQKPEALLGRIVKASSNKGDLVLDPFCGCGTTIAVAQKLERCWIGIDITHLAITLMKKRLLDAFGTEARYKVIGEPTSLPDAAALAASDPYQFQWWALGLVGARPADQKKGADKGIDGRIIFQGDEVGKFEQVILSVKAGHTGRDHVHSLRGVVDREKAAIGMLISMNDPTGPMKEEAVTAGFFESKAWGKKYPKIQLLTIAEILAGKVIDMPPIKQVSATFKKAERFKRESEQLEIKEK